MRFRLSLVSTGRFLSSPQSFRKEEKSYSMLYEGETVQVGRRMEGPSLRGPEMVEFWVIGCLVCAWTEKTDVEEKRTRVTFSYIQPNSIWNSTTAGHGKAREEEHHARAGAHPLLKQLQFSNWQFVKALKAFNRLETTKAVSNGILLRLERQLKA